MKKFEKLLIATKNPSKVEYYKSILVDIAENIIGINELNLDGKPTEAGSTAVENAKIKAKFYSKQSGLPVFSEDEALYVDFLPKSKQPGTHVRRINGRDEVDDDQLLKHWESLIEKVPVEKRTGKWRIAYCIALPNGKFKTVCKDHPVMFFSPSSKTRLPGWPMSSLQGSIRFKKPNSEYTPKEKEISRLESAKELRKCLKDLIW